jgi:guanosine-3',5'-bis(diphosphate) 3'-pyrophosphohydrolase
MKVSQNTEQAYDAKIDSVYRSIIRKMKQTPRADKVLIRRAFEYAKAAHHGVKRKSGEPYILHPLAVAKIIVVEMGLEDPVAVMCAFLHDVVEDTEIELSDIQREFGVKVREIIDGLTKISGSVVIDEMNSTQAENFRKILLTISNDVRVVLIKLSDRLHNMRTLGAMKPEKMLKIASETLYIYAPLSHRLGLYEIKTELENLSFKFSQPSNYETIARKLEATKEEAQSNIDRFTKGIKKALSGLDLRFKVKHRFKSIYSIYQKMQRKDLPFEKVFDKYAVRIILEAREGKEKGDCWNVYSILSDIYTPNPKRVRDWISVPKDNGYESLHTTLLGPDRTWVEVQIRTERMDDIAEKGIAAHWKYKEDGTIDEYLAEWIAQIREILENPQLNALEAVREFRENLQPNDVFVFTPKGEMIRLPAQSTVLDFAYKIHTDIGSSTIGAKVNNQVVAMDYTLKPGDHIEVLTSKKQKPTSDWLRFIKTAKAKDQIKHALRKEKRDKIEQGRHLFYWKARQYDVDENHPYMKEILAYFKKATVEDFFYAIGAHKIDTKKIPEFIDLKKAGKTIPSEPEVKPNAEPEIPKELEQVEPKMFVLSKEQNFDHYVLSKCCKPIPGDDILGFEDKNKIEIHRVSCENALSLMSSFGSRIIKARWEADGQSEVSFLVGVKVVGLDKQGMLNDLIRIISLRMKLNIRKVTIESRDKLFEGFFSIFMHNTEELQQLINRIEAIPHVYTVSRVDSDNDSQPFSINE